MARRSNESFRACAREIFHKSRTLYICHLCARAVPRTASYDGALTFEDVHLFWLEDVTAHDDYAGLARVADALATPLAGGECVYGITPFRHMLEARSIDIVMIDLLRVGGIANGINQVVLSNRHDFSG